MPLVLIDSFPHALYDPSARFGYLAHYYPMNLPTRAQWRDYSYSPNILDFKEGKSENIRYFVEPFLTLLNAAVNASGRKQVILIPVPTSIAHHSPEFSRAPKQPGKGRNRDDRLILFCNMLQEVDRSLIVGDWIRRSVSKTSKETWTAEKHEESMQSLIPKQGLITRHRSLYVLVDDVFTKGGTINGATLVLQREVPQSSIVRLCIGQTRNPNQFLSL